MRVLTDKYDLPRFFGELSRAQSRVLFIDCDGILAPSESDPALAKPYPGVEELLGGLMEHGKTRLVLVPGRSTDNLASQLKLGHRPEVWGPCGLELLGGDSDRPEIPPVAAQALHLASEWARKEDLLHRLQREPGRLALNLRGMDLVLSRRAVDRVAPYWEELADQNGLVLERTDAGLELRVAALNKGDAVRTVLSQMDNSPVAAYLGDDLTDEAAFRALDERGLGVLVRPKQRATSADIWIRPPEELLDFLRSWLKAEGVELVYNAAGGNPSP